MRRCPGRPVRRAGIVRGEVIEVETRAGKLPGGDGIVGMGLVLRLRAMEFRLGARGENRVARFAGENDSSGDQQEKRGQPSAGGRGAGSWN